MTFTFIHFIFNNFKQKGVSGIQSTEKKVKNFDKESYVFYNG